MTKQFSIFRNSTKLAFSVHIIWDHSWRCFTQPGTKRRGEGILRMEEAGTSEEDNNSQDSNTPIDHGHLACNCSIKIVSDVFNKLMENRYRIMHQPNICSVLYTKDIIYNNWLKNCLIYLRKYNRWNPYPSPIHSGTYKTQLSLYFSLLSNAGKDITVFYGL